MMTPHLIHAIHQQREQEMTREIEFKRMLRESGRYTGGPSLASRIIDWLGQARIQISARLSRSTTNAAVQMDEPCPIPCP